MRLFVSVAVPPFSIPGLGPSATGSAPAHLTLKFLGEVGPERVGEIGRALETGIQGAPAFPLSLEGMGVFPSPERPRVLWVGVGQGRAQLEDLASRTEGALSAQGFPREDRPFAAHVTVRRLSSHTDPRQTRALLERHRATIFASGWVRSVELMESELAPQGARHRELLRIPLGGALP